MSSADYLHCSSADVNCKGYKLVYTGDRFWDEEPPKIYCDYCYQKLIKKINKLEQGRR